MRGSHQTSDSFSGLKDPILKFHAKSLTKICQECTCVQGRDLLEITSFEMFEQLHGIRS